MNGRINEVLNKVEKMNKTAKENNRGYEEIMKSIDIIGKNCEDIIEIIEF
jgi:methyl-accepting chemotaxis protein